MSKITPIRLGAEPPSSSDGDEEGMPINIIDAHLAQAKAICDLVAMVEREAVFDDTIAWALHSAIDHIDAARETAEKLHKEAQARQGGEP